MTAVQTRLIGAMRPFARLLARRAVVVSFVALTLLLVGAAPASAIPREAALARGMAWINIGVPYSQTRYYGGYRTDCSGFVSMCWNTTSSYSTRTLHDVAYPITADDLQPGDALLKAGNHVRLFAGWVDAEQTRYVAYEETGPGAVQTVKYIDADIAYGYIPYRYRRIEASPVSWNLLANPTFDVWSTESPVWWSVGRDASGTVSTPRREGARTPRYSMAVTNRSLDAGRWAQAVQTVAVEASSTYALSLWARTDREPQALQVRWKFVDAAGRTLVETWTAGDRAGLNAAAFAPVSFVCTAPSGATSATVTLRLAGGAYVSTDTAGSALFDDFALYRTSPLDVYRFFNLKTGSHFYTASGPERDNVIRKMWGTYRYEGVAYPVSSSAANSQGLHRFFNVRNGTHFYTASEAERADVIRRLSAIYRYEGVAYKVSPRQVTGALVVYRFFNLKTGSHFYTASEAERDSVRAKLSAIYRYEGPAFYIAP